MSRVVESRHPGFREGELVLANVGWQDYALSDGHDLQPLGDLPHPSHALGGLGMPGFTAHVGLLDIGQPKPGERFDAFRREMAQRVTDGQIVLIEDVIDGLENAPLALQGLLERKAQFRHGPGSGGLRLPLGIEQQVTHEDVLDHRAVAISRSNADSDLPHPPPS